MPQAELLEWQHYAELEPFGSHYDDLRAGQIAAATYNVNRDRDKHPSAFGPLDFAPWNDTQRQTPAPPESIDPEAQSNALRQLLGFGR